MASFAGRLKELREAKGLSQEALAKLFHLSQSIISHYEAGRKQPSYQTMQQFADFFGVSMDHLLGRTEMREPTPRYFHDGNKTYDLDAILGKGTIVTKDGRVISEEDKHELRQFAKYGIVVRSKVKEAENKKSPGKATPPRAPGK